MFFDNIAIRVRNPVNKYTLVGSQEKFLTLRDAIVNSVKTPFRRIHRAPSTEGFWALKDVSFMWSKARLSGSSEGIVRGN